MKKVSALLFASVCVMTLMPFTAFADCTQTNNLTDVLVHKADYSYYTSATQLFSNGIKAACSSPLWQITLNLKKSGTPTDNYYIQVYASSGSYPNDIPTGSVLATSTNVSASSLTTSYASTTFSFDGTWTPTSGVLYDFVLNRSNHSDTSNYVVGDAGSNQAGTNPFGGLSNNLGTSWIAHQTYLLLATACLATSESTCTGGGGGGAAAKPYLWLETWWM